jgi:hypothetical protein
MKKRQRVQRTPISAMNVGDEFVTPKFLQAYGEDKDGFTTLSAEFAGIRYRLTHKGNEGITAEPLTDGGVPVKVPVIVTGHLRRGNETLLKVVDA